ncbi:hypothetical protein [Bombella pollinis]|uniref:Uncharacterized protein n=1 Tax=Bombella pollinis TaxID=2967337 RepID=A0ABT3WN07_9PROT|nr:hypothetical protein [Bombella pollinis]MCX5620436.1 hypothetical protein [Bombella pollinis]
MAMVFWHQNEAFTWHFYLKRKKSFDYGQPTIALFGLNYMNTLRVSAVSFLRVIKKEGEESLYGIGLEGGAANIL